MSGRPGGLTGVLDAPVLRLPRWASYTSLLLAYLYVSRFVPDFVVLPLAAAFLLIGSARLSRSGVAMLLAVCVLLGAQVLVLGGRVEHPLQIAHVLVVLFLVLALDDPCFDPRVLDDFCRFTTVVNVSLMAMAWAPGMNDLVYWGEDRGVSRYMSILPEPSFVGLYSVLNFFVLWRAGRRAWAFANLLPLAASFSFAGAISLGLLGMVFLRSMWRPAIVAALALGAGLLGFFLVQPEMFTALLVNRVLGVAGGLEDESLVLRVFAPLDLIDFTLRGDPLQVLFGLGMGNVEHYIYYEQAALERHWRASGERSAQPDSIVAFVISAFGIVGLVIMLALLGWLALTRPRRPEFAPIRPFLLIIVLFTGLFVSLHFWVWIYLLRQERLTGAHSPIGSQAAVSSG